VPTFTTQLPVVCRQPVALTRPLRCLAFGAPRHPAAAWEQVVEQPLARYSLPQHDTRHA